MGYGEVIGNRSVHWRIVHEDYDSQTAPPEGAAAARGPGGSPKRRARLTASPDVPGSDSEARKNLQLMDYEARGTDTVEFAEIGKCGGTKRHPGKFRASLRFEDRKTAEEELRKATVKPLTADGKTVYVIEFDVPAIYRKGEDVGPPCVPPAEIRVDW